jgi:hypothetical protein
MLYQNPNIYVDDSLIHGRGVFTSALINSGSLIEECHFFKLNEFNINNIIYSLKERVMPWPNKISVSTYILTLGYGCIYNHSIYPNAIRNSNIQKSVIEIYSIQDIQPGEEITYTYNTNFN